MCRIWPCKLYLYRVCMCVCVSSAFRILFNGGQNWNSDIKKPVQHSLIIMVTEISGGGGANIYQGGPMTPPPPPPPKCTPVCVFVINRQTQTDGQTNHPCCACTPKVNHCCCENSSLHGTQTLLDSYGVFNRANLLIPNIISEGIQLYRLILKFTQMLLFLLCS